MTLGKLFNILGTVLIAIIVVVWGIILVQVWRHPVGPDSPAFAPNPELFLVAGALLTALATNTAAALGFSISEIKAATLLKRQETPSYTMSLSDSAAVVGYPVILATFVYLALGITIAFTAWVPIGAGGTAALSVYAVTFFGWVVGALPVLLKAPS